MRADPYKEPEKPLEGSLVGGRYRVERCVGRGGFGEVYLARDTKLNRRVALKRLIPESQNRSRLNLLRAEAFQLAQLDHPNITMLFDTVDERDGFHIVMQYIDGISLRQFMNGPLEPGVALPIAIDLCEALKAAHASNILHGDLKPENVLLEGEQRRVRVCDFGLSRVLRRKRDASTMEITIKDALRGTPAYIAPETIPPGLVAMLGAAPLKTTTRKPDVRSDIFSLGVVLYEMLAGQNPFEGGETKSTLTNVLRAEVGPLSRRNPNVSLRLERTILAMLQREADDRPATMQALLQELREASSAPAITTTRTTGTRTLPSQKSIAIFPFEAIGGKEPERAFADGLVEAITAQIGKSSTDRSLQITPLSLLRRYKVSYPMEANAEFGANLAITGSVQWAQEKLRVNFSLFLLDPQELLLDADSIVLDAADTFAVQDAVVAALLRMLALAPTPEPRAQRNPAESAAWSSYTRGRGYLQHFDRQENLDCSIEEFLRAIAINPLFAEAHAGLAEAYCRTLHARKEDEWVKKARASCDQALQLDDNLAAAHAADGMILTATGEYELALAAYNRALEIEPTVDDYYVGLALAYENLGRLEEAEATYRRALKERPHYWANHNSIAIFFARQKRFKEAAEELNEVLRIAPDSFRAYSNFGTVYNGLGEVEKAYDALERANQIRPTAEAALNLGAVYFKQKEYEKAAVQLRTATELNKSDFRAWGSLGASLSQCGNKKDDAREAYKRAVDLAEKRLQMNSKDTTTRSLLSVYYSALGDDCKAEEYMEQALGANSEDTFVWINAALICEEHLKRREDAVSYLVNALSKNKNCFREIEVLPGLQGLLRDPRIAAILEKNRATS